MTREETIIILKKFKAAYRNFYKDMKKEEAYDMIDTWEMMFAEDDAKLVQLAIIKLIATESFPPDIAKIRDAMATITQGEQMTAGEAWQLVTEAISKFGWPRSDEATASLPPIVQEAVRNMGGIMELCRSENVIADRAHFIKIFEILAKREKDNAQLPNNLKLELKKARESYQIEHNKNLLEDKSDDEQFD